MYYEMRTYTIQIGKMKDYLAHFEEFGLPAISKYAQLVAWWYTEIGELNQVIHVWAYESLDDRTSRRAALYKDEDWLNKFMPKAFPMIVKQESKLLLAANFSPIK
ncbi:NIPSNAP family protein [Halomonas hibernica]|uniref:NIPSNAP family protein n=1 Tax=Halomonas hibernica TaxID=2591147 RepID=UPI001556C6EB|nr:NIPSNAP family protein [Halomonas hibernica]